MTAVPRHFSSIVAGAWIVSCAATSEISDIASSMNSSPRKAIKKKIVIWAQMPIIEQKKKVYTFLAQRGFSSVAIENIIDGLGKKDYN